MKRLFDPAQLHFAAWVWLYDIDRYLGGTDAHDAPNAARGCATLLCLSVRIRWSHRSPNRCSFAGRQ
jgi:hypothetical protein